jgi:hypothetical protein
MHCGHLRTCRELCPGPAAPGTRKIVTYPPVRGIYLLKSFQKHVEIIKSSNRWLRRRLSQPPTGSRGRVKPNQKEPWVKTISKGHEIRVVQPKVDRTKNKNPLPYGRGDAIIEIDSTRLPTSDVVRACHPLASTHSSLFSFPVAHRAWTFVQISS